MGIRYLDEPQIKSRIRYLDEQPQEASTPPISFLPGAQKTERMIAQRPSAVETLQEEVQTPYDLSPAAIVGMKGPKKSPLLKSFVTGGKALMVPYQRLESAIANPLMKAQEITTQEAKQNPSKFVGQVLQSSLEGMEGKRRGTLADIPRRALKPSLISDPVSDTIGFFSSMGTLNLATKGKLVESAKKAEQVLSSKMPKFMGKDYVIQRAETASRGLDDLYEGLSKEYDNVYEKIGSMQINPQQQQMVQEALSELPQTLINKISRSKLLSRTQSGEIVPDMNNLKIIKGMVRKSVPDRIWSGRAIGTPESAAIEQVHGKIASIMAEGNPELQAINKKYADFMNMRKEISSIIYDGQGNLKANGLRDLFGNGGERGKQIFFEKFAKQWPQAGQIIKDIQKYNTRQSLKSNIVKGSLILGGYEAGRRFIANPILEKFSGR